MSNTPVFGLRLLTEAMTEAAKATSANETTYLVEALLAQSIVRRDLTAPPAGVDGDVYIVSDTAAASGLWVGQENNLAIYFGGWIFVSPVRGPQFLDVNAGQRVEWNGSAWAQVATGGASANRYVQTIALSDLSTVITTGTNKDMFRMPAAVTLTEVRASLSTADDDLFTVDINENGTSILSTKLTIDTGETTSVTAATPAVISDAALADDAEISFDVDTAGTTATGLKVTLIGTFN